MVGISLLTLVPGVVGGSETYARELVRALARVGELDYRVFVPAIAEDAADGLPSRTVRSYRAGRSMPRRVVAISLAAAAGGRVRRELELGSLDAIHFPLSVMLPPVSRPPAATTVLDVQHELYPQFFSRAELAYRRAVYGWTVRRSRIVITISEHARRGLIDRLSLDPARVRAIHLGIDHERFRPAPDGVEARGRVAGDDLVRLYRTAAALVFPSLYEGFGQPPLEAMACGCPVACSNAASLPEVVGDAARLFDPMSVDDMAAAIEDVLDAPDEWKRRGLERSRRFSWDECARRHEEVYRELSG